jgi:hypothetical protein
MANVISKTFNTNWGGISTKTNWKRKVLLMNRLKKIKEQTINA